MQIKDIGSFTRVVEGTIVDKRFVKPGTDVTEMQQCDTAGEKAIGVALYDYSADEQGIYQLGQILVEYGGTVVADDPLATDANGKAVKAVPGQYVNAVAKESGADTEHHQAYVLPMPFVMPFSTQAVADLTALKAIAAADRSQGMLVTVAADGSGAQALYQFDADGATATNEPHVVVPTAGTGIWLRVGKPTFITNVADLTALKAIAAAHRYNAMPVVVDTDGTSPAFYVFDADGAATANEPEIVAPDAGTGRWLLIGGSVNTAKVSPVRLQDFKLSTLLELAATADGTNHGLSAGTHGSASPHLVGSAANNNSKTEVSRVLAVVPPDYVAGEDLTLRIHCRVDGDAAVGQTVDAEVFVGDKELGIGSDLASPAAQAIPNAWGDVDFAVDGSGLTPGSVLDIELTTVVNDTGGTLNKAAQIGDVSLVYTAKR